MQANRSTTLARFIAVLGCLATAEVQAAAKSAPLAHARAQVTILYDAFGKDPEMKKDWGFSALVEVAGKRILFDTGNNRDVFTANAKAKDVNFNKLDFVVMSHRHSDHMAGLSRVLKVNPEIKVYAPKEGFGIYGSSLPSSFYRKNESLAAEMRYFDGKPPETMTFGAAWPGANFEVIDKTTEIAPGIWLIALVSDLTGTKELKELSLAINTPEGLVLVVGCSHPGIEKIVEAASAINPRIHYIVGGFHLVTAPDDAIAKVATALKETWKVENIAPGHCTGEPTFAALREAFGNSYVYAGVGTVLKVGAPEKRAEASQIVHLASFPATKRDPAELRGSDAALSGQDLDTYRALAGPSINTEIKMMNWLRASFRLKDPPAAH
jgi:7,8-dihydropterin-6-yl-methyl-4-(beta-D-ribofuranosyl)aminobenzene 5'-phosphate synthase